MRFFCLVFGASPVDQVTRHAQTAGTGTGAGNTAGLSTGGVCKRVRCALRNCALLRVGVGCLVAAHSWHREGAQAARELPVEWLFGAGFGGNLQIHRNLY
jgi:hypothetical protein